MRVLVAYASRTGGTGGTAEIAERTGRWLRETGFDLDTRPFADAPDASGYDAVVLGSALYARHWKRSAVNYLRTQAVDLEGRPVWLFQSSPFARARRTSSSPPL
ncbi:MAG: flavodoxin domain-containing protein [Propionibacteriaceae bacterium]